MNQLRTSQGGSKNFGTESKDEVVALSSRLPYACYLIKVAGQEEYSTIIFTTRLGFRSLDDACRVISAVYKNTYKL